MEFNIDELRLIAYALRHCDNLSVPTSLQNAFDEAIERAEMVDMSDWNDCGDACKL